MLAKHTSLGTMNASLRTVGSGMTSRFSPDPTRPQVGWDFQNAS